MSTDFLKKVLEQERPNAGEPPDDPAVYRAYKAVARPQMGFTAIQANGDIDGFLYHNLDNLSMQHRERAEFLTFTHRGKAVTIQGSGLKDILRALMGHNLVEIREHDGRPVEPGQPVVTRMAVTMVTESAKGSRLP
jgi:hypothetical protein